MEFKTVIEVKAFADFDVIYTECVMVSSEELNVKDVMSEFYKIQGITSNKGFGL